MTVDTIAEAQPRGFNPKLQSHWVLNLVGNYGRGGKLQCCKFFGMLPHPLVVTQSVTHRQFCLFLLLCVLCTLYLFTPLMWPSSFTWLSIQLVHWRLNTHWHWEVLLCGKKSARYEIYWLARKWLVQIFAPILAQILYLICICIALSLRYFISMHRPLPPRNLAEKISRAKMTALPSAII